MREHDIDAGQTARSFDRLTGAILDGRYRLDEKIAAGGFGSIYRAMDLVMGREVALKVLHRELAHDDSVVERFRREASALAKLRNPHTITMYDVGESPDGTRYIVMELLRGESLHDQFHAHGQHLPWLRVAKIARGVCSSLREAHSVGIVHRDLKPANIHLEQHALERDYVKVLDFGIAKVVDAHEPNRDLTLAGQLIGTFEYMPPEQMIGGRCTGKSDVFTLAVVIYEMIAGERPYGDARGPATALMQMLGTTPRPLSFFAAVPAELDALVQRAIVHDPELRPDIFEFDAELARILEHSGVAEGSIDITFEEAGIARDEAAFSDEDGPTWVESIAPSPSPQAPSRTMLGTFTPITPAGGNPSGSTLGSPGPSQFAVGSRTAIPPMTEVAPPRIERVPAPRTPVRVRFRPPSLSPPARLPSGTTPIQNEPVDSRAKTEPSSHRVEVEAERRREWRADFLRGFLYALVILAVVAAIAIAITARS
jgi:serine/threonine protein kinase